MNEFNADIIHETGAGYRAIFSFPDQPDIDIDLCGTWKDFADEIQRVTGIRIPARKYFRFSRLSDFETLAGIDASHIRKQGCIVTSTDRKNGWCRWEF